MTEHELKELFKELEKRGWEPRLCDTPIPLYTCGVPAGSVPISRRGTNNVSTKQSALKGNSTKC